MLLQLNKIIFILLANTISNVFRCFYFGVVYVHFIAPSLTNTLSSKSHSNLSIW